ncbi:MAG: L-serine ammonia-lyase [Bacteroidetes bacterium]|nr:L-serine ammonia-lyase [Bacteroidota bacterium]
MESIREIFKIGNGPSSSHTMGPKKAANLYKEKHPSASSFRAILYGSLAATGEGHLTDKVILDTFAPRSVEIIWEPGIFLPEHPNGMKFEALDAQGVATDVWTTFSIGGGDISDNGQRESKECVYEFSTMKEILAWCEQKGCSFWEYVDQHEPPGLWESLSAVWKTMQEIILRGLDTEGVIQGGLNLPRKASSFYIRAKTFQPPVNRRPLTYAYALAVSEENACGGTVVTAPTCGSCGVIPAVLYLFKTEGDYSDNKILRALATAGLIGTLIKTNASISGAEVGCQGEVGSACSMAAGAAAQLLGGSPGQVEYAASIGMEHFLGLTCDPLKGLVQIPCIERNAMAASRALDAATYALMTDGHHVVGFDRVIRVMKETGHDLPGIYKETAEGGLAIEP